MPPETHTAYSETVSIQKLSPCVFVRENILLRLPRPGRLWSFSALTARTSMLCLVLSVSLCIATLRQNHQAGR